MENEKRNNNGGLIALVVVLVLLVLGLGGYIVYDKVLSSNSTQPIIDDNNSANSNQQNNVVDNDDEQNSNSKQKNTNENTNNVSNQVDGEKDLYAFPLNNNPATRALFKMTKIKDVYIETFIDEGGQCDKTNIIIFNSHGTILKELNLFYARVDINDDTITIEYTKTCRSIPVDDNSGTLKYKIAGSDIVEQ